jgi:hypothetical protein
MRPGNEIIIDSFIFEDFDLPVVKTEPPVTEDYCPPVDQFSRRRMGQAVLTEWEQVCLKNRRLCAHDEN